jgi:3-isopropylmalate/(R)-2-methylmalate dehydratase small subunit
MKKFGGSVLFLDRSDINTDEIIPAKYLTEISKAALKRYCLEDLKLPGFEGNSDVAGKGAVVTRANFGCGSSREHAPWALEANGVHLVVAESFARIFRQNMYNCGLIAAELPVSTLDALFSVFSGMDARVEVDIDSRQLTFSTAGDAAPSMTVPFRLSDFEFALVEAGGWVDFAAKKY